MRGLMLHAHECNSGQPPMSPLYYATFVDDWFSRGGKLRVSLRNARHAAGHAADTAPHPLDAALRAMQPPAEPRPPIEPI
jgi:hypothetical protein